MGASQVTLVIKDPLANAGDQETEEIRVPSLSQKDPLEKGMATHCSILAWRIPRAEEPGRLQCIGSQRDRKSVV